MTSRGRKPPIALPRPDPTLETRPVPRERHYTVRAFGPGAATEPQNFRSIKELQQEPVDTSSGGIEEDAKELLRLLTKESNMEWRHDDIDLGEPTWGPTIVVTAYSEKATEHLDQAITNLVETIHRLFLRCSRTRPFAEEAFKRLEFKVLQDSDVLRDASDDRVREEFNAYVRSLQLFPADLRWEKERQKRSPDNLNRPDGPRRYGFCIVLDEDTIENLAAINFPSELAGDKELLKNISLKVVDRKWRYPETTFDEYGSGTSRTVYTGTDRCPLLDLPLICAMFYQFAGLHEMFPLQNYRLTS